MTAWPCDPLPCVLCLAGGQKPARDIKMGGGIVPSQPQKPFFLGIQRMAHRWDSEQES